MIELRWTLMRPRTSIPKILDILWDSDCPSRTWVRWSNFVHQALSQAFRPLGLQSCVQNRCDDRLAGVSINARSSIQNAYSTCMLYNEEIYILNRLIKSFNLSFIKQKKTVPWSWFNVSMPILFRTVFIRSYHTSQNASISKFKVFSTIHAQSV